MAEDRGEQDSRRFAATNGIIGADLVSDATSEDIQDIEREVGRF